MKNAPPPNIILLFADDLGWMDLGCYGNQYHETPNLDRIAAEGMRFTDAYSNAANCAPSRACLLTGRYVPRHGVYTVGSAESFDHHEHLLDRDERYLLAVENNEGFSPDFPVIGESLRAAGYATALFGKVHSFFPENDWPNMTEINPVHCQYIQDKAFDEVLVARDFNHLGSNFSTPVETKNLAVPMHETQTERSLTFIENNTDRPFFLYVPYILPHIPYKAPADLVAKYEDKPASDRLTVKNPTYAAMIEMLDNSVGKIYDKLQELNIANNTLIVFTSDNGAPNKHNRPYEGHINLPLRGGKCTFFEGGIRVPFIVKWPDRIAPGSVCREPVSLIDLYPSFLEAAAVNSANTPSLDGQSMVPLWNGNVENPAKRSIYWHFPGYWPGLSRPVSVIRWGDYKLIENFERDTFELYNLNLDTAEKYNLVQLHPHLYKTLYDDLKLWQEKTGAQIPTVNPDWDPANEGKW